MSLKSRIGASISGVLSVAKEPKERVWFAESVFVWFVAAAGAGIVGGLVILADRQLYPVVMVGILGVGWLIDGAWAFAVQRHLRHEVLIRSRRTV